MSRPLTTPGGFPARPSDVPPDASLGELVEAVLDHWSTLVDSRHGLGDLVPAGQLAGHALAALATAHALAERVLAPRWVCVIDSLTYGATLRQVADAMGLDVDEVVAGLTSWADGQRREGSLSGDGHTAVLGLLASEEGT